MSNDRVGEKGKLLSIIVPSYDMERYLPNGLGSLVVGDAELLRSLDVIVVNDGSKDRTSEIAHGFEAKYPGVFRVLDKPNGNYGSCVNAALPLALGRFVKILDADDSCDTAAFARYLRALAALPATTDMVISDFVQVDASGRVTASTAYPFPTDAAFGLAEIISRDRFIDAHAVAYRTALLREIGYRQTEGISHTDTEWANLPVTFARDVRYVPEPVYRYLLGRAGQTMERRTRVKNVWMQDMILEGLMRRHDTEVRARDAKAYLQQRIRQLFAFSMRAHLEDAFSPGLKDYLDWVRQKTADYGFLADVVREESILSSTPLRFRHAAFVLRHPALARPTLLAVNAYGRIIRLVRRRR